MARLRQRIRESTRAFGAVFQNRLLIERTAQLLESAGLRVLVPRQLPPNDGGISFGQVAVAGGRGTARWPPVLSRGSRPPSSASTRSATG